MLILASSCARESVESADMQGKQISFKTALGKQTRAEEFTYWTSTAGENSFPIKAYKTGTADAAYINDILSYDGTDWTYVTPKDQPGYDLTYYAWYPTAIATDAEFAGDGTGATLEYEVAGTAAAQEDLIAATTHSGLPAINLEFDHILSQINFAIQGVEEVAVMIEDIKVNGVKGSGTYTFGGDWGSLVAAAAPYAYVPVATAGDASDYTTDGSDAMLYLGNGGGTYDNDNALMLLPQTFAAAADGNFSFDFTLTDVNNGTLQDSGSFVVNFCDLNIAEWEAGTRYLYIIDFTDYLVGGKIRFTVTVNPWIPDASDEAQVVYAADATQLSIEAAIATQDADNALAGMIAYPIWVPADLTASVALANFNGLNTNFAIGDVVKIYFPSAAGIANLTLEPGSDMEAAWTLDNSANPVTLTKK